MPRLSATGEKRARLVEGAGEGFQGYYYRPSRSRHRKRNKIEHIQYVYT